MYELNKLGWKDFQKLCHTITREILGQTIESFLDSHDGGRDGAFSGTWDIQNEESLKGRFVIQCKYSGRQNISITMSNLADEFEKVEKLVKAGLCDSYVLMTNMGVSGTRDKEIQAQLKQIGVKQTAVFGSTWINQQILENTRLRMLVPRIYGLGDLSQILDSRAYSQARVVLDTMREDLAKVVLTHSYQKAVNAINEHGFVMIIGEPASGKTTIASLLAMASLDQWGSGLLKLDDPAKVVEHWNPDEPSQFFWLDDVFGVTQYEKYLTTGWNHIFPQVKAMIGSGVKIVMTSRDYIYSSARHDLKHSIFPLLNETQVVVDVHNLSIDEKEQILYNHLKIGKQSIDFIGRIKPLLNDIANHERFVPETARRISDPIFTSDLSLTSGDLNNFVGQQEQLLSEVLNGLDDGSKAALALIYLRRNHLNSPVELNHDETSYIERLNSNTGGCLAALQALNTSLVIHNQAEQDPHWSFKHPTIGDAFAKMLVEYPEYLGIYLQGADPETLTRQISCGNKGIQGAIIVPESLWTVVLAKLQALSTSKDYKTPWLSTWNAKRSLHTFLLHRCSDEFIRLYLASNPSLIENIKNPSMSLRYSTDVSITKLLFDLSILPEDSRTSFGTCQPHMDSLAAS